MGLKIWLFVIWVVRIVLLNISKEMKMKKKYIKPVLETEEILERVVLGCSLQEGACDPKAGTSTS